MSFEFLLQSIAEGLLIALIIFGLIFEKYLVRFERKAYIYAKACFKNIVLCIKEKIKNAKYNRSIKKLGVSKGNSFDYIR